MVPTYRQLRPMPALVITSLIGCGPRPVIVGTGSGNSIPDPRSPTGRSPSSRRASSADVPRTWAASPRRCSCIPPTWPLPPAGPAAGRRPWTCDGCTGRRSGTGSSAGSTHLDGGRRYRTDDRHPNVTVYEGYARFIGTKNSRCTAPTGRRDDHHRGPVRGRRRCPPRPPCRTSPGCRRRRHTSDTVMRIDGAAAPGVRSSAVASSAAEFAHVFASFGSDVTVMPGRMRCCAITTTDIAQAFHRTGRAALRRPPRHRGRRSSRQRGRAPVLTGPRRGDRRGGPAADRHRPGAERGPAGRGATARRGAGGLVVVAGTSGPRWTASTPWAICPPRTQLKHVANHEARVVHTTCCTPTP